jgi:sulfite exporter TauE/SafE
MMNHFMAAAAPISLVAAFVAGAAGSVHCLAMCGGISGALGMRAKRNGVGPRQAFVHSMTYQVGRIGSYSVAGALVGGLGGALQSAFDFNRVALVSRVLAGTILVLAAIGVLSKWRPLSSLERLGGRLWQQIAPLARAVPADGLGGSLLLGMLWGWLPCGLIYSMLLIAALSGSVFMGAATMLSFGVGTAPAVLAAGLAGGQVWRTATARGWNFAAGSLLLAFGLVTMLGPLGLHTHH